MDELTFLKQIALMVNTEDTEHPAPWEQVPEKSKEDFKSWCQEAKQKNWPDRWEAGWSKYHLEYLRHVIDMRITEIQRIKDIDYKWKKSEPDNK